MKHVSVLGSSNIDLTYQVTRIPDVGSTVEASDFARGTGGKGANQAYAVAYWGVPVSFIGAVGDDENGATLVAQLRDFGIDVTNLITVGGAPSGTAVVYVDPQGDNCIVVHPGANHRVPTDICDTVRFTEGDLLLSQLEVNLDAVIAGFDAARRRGATTVLNPSPLKPIPETLLQGTSILVANVQEAEELSGLRITGVSSARSCAIALRKRGPEKVAITLGGAGAIFLNGAECSYVEGVKLETVDTQGAGDAFLGAFVARLALGDPEAEALAFGNLVAAYSVTMRGSTQRSLPERNDPFLSKEQRILTV